MNVMIQISDNGAVTSSTDSESSTSGLNTPGAAGNASDGGAPKASLTGSDSSNASGGSDVTDIGGPPQWLSEAIGNKSSGDGDTSSFSPSAAGGDGQDAGTAPSFD